MVGGTWLAVPRLWSCGSTLGIRLKRSFIQIAVNGSSESSVTNAVIRMNVQIGMGCLSLEAITFVCPTSIVITESGSHKSKKGRSAESATTQSKREKPLFQRHSAGIDS